MTLRRYYDATLLNSVVNDPSVQPWVVPWGVARPLDCTPQVRDLRNVLLMDASGGFLFQYCELAVYEVHTQFLPEGRGSAAIEAATAAMDYMFMKTDCMELTTRIPGNNAAARALALAVGFRQDFVVPKAWQSGPKDFEALGCYVLTWRDWIRNGHRLSAQGEWFHERITALWPQAPEHPADSHHDRVVGATLGMILGGQLDKALSLYNRWARLAGYDPLVLVSRNPIVMENSGVVMLLETEPKVDLLLLQVPSKRTAVVPMLEAS